MPGNYEKRRTGLKPRTPRAGVPLPGVGGYDYPRGPFGATGFPGSTPASKRTKNQTRDGRRDRQLTASGAQARDTGPEFDGIQTTAAPKPQPPYGSVRFRPGTAPSPGNRYLRGDGTPRQPRYRTMRETAPERRETPIIGGAPGSQNCRNTYAQRYKARPELIRAYTPSPNPGKTGARLDGTSQYHPGVFVHGHPDGKPVPGMDANPGVDSPAVIVQSRYVSAEGSQEGYAMNRDLSFAKGGVAGYPSSYPRFTGNQHLRGARLTGQRYFGALKDQQRIGLDTDAYGISRARGPRHRPVKFEQPQPWAANYYDVAPDAGSSAPDMIRKSPAARGRSSGRPRRG